MHSLMIEHAVDNCVFPVKNMVNLIIFEPAGAPDTLRRLSLSC